MNMSDHIVSKINSVLGRPAVTLDEYKFLDDRLTDCEPVIICFGGSIAYGTNTLQSDVDIRGAALATSDDILLGKDFDQIGNIETDTTIYSFRKLVKFLTGCNPNTIEMLGLRPEHYLYLSPVGQELIKRKNMFLSKLCIDTFKNYAEQQLYKLRQKSTSAMSEEDFNKHIAATMTRMISKLENEYGIKGVSVREQDAKLLIDVSVHDYPMDKLSGMLGVLNNTLRDYSKRSSRNEKAIAHDKIEKHSMHLLRLYMMAEDLLLDGEIVTYREKEHDLLMDIKQGKYLDETGYPNKEFFDIVDHYKARFEHAVELTELPEEPDLDAIDNFIREVHRDKIRRD